MDTGFVLLRINDEISRLEREAANAEDRERQVFALGQKDALEWVRGLMKGI